MGGDDDDGGGSFILAVYKLPFILKLMKYMEICLLKTNVGYSSTSHSSCVLITFELNID